MNGYATRKHLHSINGLTLRERNQLERDERDRPFKRLCVGIVVVVGMVLYAFHSFY